MVMTGISDVKFDPTGMYDSASINATQKKDSAGIPVYTATTLDESWWGDTFNSSQRERLYSDESAAKAFERQLYLSKNDQKFLFDQLSELGINPYAVMSGSAAHVAPTAAPAHSSGRSTADTMKGLLGFIIKLVGAVSGNAAGLAAAETAAAASRYRTDLEHDARVYDTDQRMYSLYRAYMDRRR